MSADTFELTNHFLIAMPGMGDNNFWQSVTLICEHNADGALGIVINRPTDITLDSVLNQMKISPISETAKKMPILFGGPIHQERGFVIHRAKGPWRSSFAVNEDIVVTTSKDILEAIAKDEGPKDLVIALGYAGWESGQLEEELKKNFWLSCPAQSNVIFDTSHDKRWQTAANILGIDISQMPTGSGNA